jgi:hypothetical protein
MPHVGDEELPGAESVRLVHEQKASCQVSFSLEHVLPDRVHCLVISR